MAKYSYPAIFEPNEFGGYCVSFPDIENVFTHGEDLSTLIDMAKDALCLVLYNMEKNEISIPNPSDKNCIERKAGEIVDLVHCDTMFYENWFSGDTAKIEVNIPLWMKENTGLEISDFNGILQRGVKDYLGITG